MKDKEKQTSNSRRTISISICSKFYRSFKHRNDGGGKVETKFFPSFLSILLSVFVFCFTSLVFTPRSDFLSTVCYLLLFSLYFLSQRNKRVKVLSHFVLHSDSIFGSSKKEKNKREERKNLKGREK